MKLCPFPGAPSSLPPSAVRFKACDSVSPNTLSMQSRIILGSESASRRAIMDELAQKYTFSYESAKAAIDESSIGSRTSDPGELVLQLARAKADAIISRLSDKQTGYLLTCDQVVVQNGSILEKPRDAQEARQFISGYGRFPGKTVGSVVCTDLSSMQTFEGVDTAEVHFQTVPKSTVEQLIKEGTVFQCAGGLMIEHPLVSPLITKIVGTRDGVMGLSKQLVMSLLLQAGANIAFPSAKRT